MIRPGVRRLFHLGSRRDDIVAADTADEIAAHLEARAAQLQAQGLSPEAARAEAQRRFGPVAEAQRSLTRAAQRRERRLSWRDRLDALRQDVRYAWRTTAAEPGFAAVVVVVIALGVGANAATFGILDRLLLRGPEHVQDPQQVRRVYATVELPGEGPFVGDPGKAASMRSFTYGTLGYVTYTTLRDATSCFTGVAAYSYAPYNFTTLGTGAAAEQVLKADATWDLFPLLGVHAALGRFFDRNEDRPGAAARVVVLGDELWRRRFDADPGVLGRTVVLDGRPFTVIGVAPPAFTGVELGRVDAWAPMSVRGAGVADDWTTTRNAQWLEVVARLRPGVTPERAGIEATAAIRPLFADTPDPLAQGDITLRPLIANRRGDEAMEVGVARWLDGVALLVLLVACANVANLLLARAIRRRREVAVRVALGVTGTRLVRLLLAQSILLAGLGGAAALAVVPLASKLLRTTLLPNVDWSGPAVEPRVLSVALALTLMAGIVTGLAPLVLVRRGDLLSALRGGVREGGGRSSRLRTLLTVAQSAFSVVLLVAAGLFLNSLWRARSVDFGLQPDRILAVGARWADGGPRIVPGPGVRPKSRGQAFYEAALARARALPWVEDAAVAVGTPFQTSFVVELRVPGWAELPALPGGGPYIQAVSPRYFATVGLRVLRGRDFTSRDGAGSERLAIVNETMARTLWPSKDALGQCLFVGDPQQKPPCARIVGVVADAQLDLEVSPAMQYYIPFGQEEGFGGTRLLVRPRGPADAMLEPLRREMRAVDPSVLWVQVGSLQEELDPALRPWRLGAVLIGIFGALALVIAAVGLYSFIGHMVASRAHELGVRVALGAQRGDVLRLVLRRGHGLAGRGLASGVAVSLAAGPRLRDLLFHTSTRDPIVYLDVVGSLLAAALVACLVPARRALRVDPVDALRDE
jgi:predicted permease